MAERYTSCEVEPHWRERWEQADIYRFEPESDRPKHYALTMLPYPSGDLHPGHIWAFGPSDTRARYMRMRGYQRLLPDGLRCLWSARRERGDQVQHSSRKPRPTKTSIIFASSSRPSAMMIDWDQRGDHAAIPNITDGTSGSSCSSTRTVWPTSSSRRWTGVPRTTRPWHANRSRVRIGTAIAAARR